jgi:hypothetical protein
MPEEKPLIDFGDSSEAKSQDLLEQTFQQLGLTSSLSGAASSSSSSSSKPSSQQPRNDIDEFLNDENEIKEMENWFKLQGGAALTSNNQNVSIFYFLNNI